MDPGLMDEWPVLFLSSIYSPNSVIHLSLALMHPLALGINGDKEVPSWQLHFINIHSSLIPHPWGTHANRISLATFQRTFPRCLSLCNFLSRLTETSFLPSPRLSPAFQRARYVFKDQLTPLDRHSSPFGNGCHPRSCFDLKINKQREIKQADPPPLTPPPLPWNGKCLCMIFLDFHLISLPSSTALASPWSLFMWKASHGCSNSLQEPLFPLFFGCISHMETGIVSASQVTSSVSLGEV